MTKTPLRFPDANGPGYSISKGPRISIASSIEVLAKLHIIMSCKMCLEVFQRWPESSNLCQSQNFSIVQLHDFTILQATCERNSPTRKVTLVAEQKNRMKW